MAWRKVNTVSIGFEDFSVPVGTVALPPSGTLEVRIKQTSPADTSLFKAGLFYVTTGNGRTLGTRKFWGHLEGEDYVLGGPGYSTTSGFGELVIEPRYLNRRVLKNAAFSPWVLDVFVDEPSQLPADRHESPGFVNQLNRLLRLTRVGTQGRITF